MLGRTLILPCRQALGRSQRPAGPRVTLVSACVAPCRAVCQAAGLGSPGTQCLSARLLSNKRAEELPKSFSFFPTTLT